MSQQNFQLLTELNHHTMFRVLKFVHFKRLIPKIGVVTATRNEVGTYLSFTIFIKPESKKIFPAERDGQVNFGDYIVELVACLNAWDKLTGVANETIQQEQSLVINLV
ncbi:MAG: hypothetical protein WBL63_09005 [Candidatus Acidiferrum sp.]